MYYGISMSEDIKQTYEQNTSPALSNEIEAAGTEQQVLLTPRQGLRGRALEAWSTACGAALPSFEAANLLMSHERPNTALILLGASSIIAALTVHTTRENHI